MVIVERPTTNNVAINFTVRTGAMFDVIDKAGLASMVSDLIMNGGTLGIAPTTIAQTIDSAAPDFKFTTEWDRTTITATMKPDDLPVILDLIGRLINYPKFEKASFEKAKADRIARLQQINKTPAELAGDVLAAKLYPRYPLGHTIDGTPQSIANLNLADVISFYKRFYIANNSSLVVVGNVGRDYVIAATRSALGQLLKGDVIPASFTPPEPPSKTSIYIVDRPTGSQSYLAIGQTGIARTSEDYFPASVLNYVIGGSASSRLSKRVSEEHYYSRDIHSDLEALRIPGPLLITAQVPTKNAGDAAAETVKVISEAHAQGLTNTEVEAAKDHFISTYDLKLETNAQLAERLAELEIYSLGRDYIINYKSRMAAVTPDQVRKAATNLLHPDAMVIVAVGPASELKESLAKLGTVEVVSYDPKAAAPPAKSETKSTDSSTNQAVKKP